MRWRLALFLALGLILGQKPGSDEQGKTTGRIPCDSKSCRALYGKIVDHGCRRLRGIYELKFADKFVGWATTHFNIQPNGKVKTIDAGSANLTRLIPFNNYQPYYPTDKYISVADIHGDFDALCKILVYAHVMNLEGSWIADAHTHIIQTGDLLDRGSQSATAYQLLFDLQDQACDLGCSNFTRKNSSCDSSNVILLYGNHEHMHLSHSSHSTIEPNMKFPSHKRISKIEDRVSEDTIRLNDRIKAFLDLPEHYELPAPALRKSGSLEEPLQDYLPVNVTESYPDLKEKISKAGAQWTDRHFIYQAWEPNFDFFGTEIVRRLQILHKVGDQVLYVHAGLELPVVEYYRTHALDGSEAVVDKDLKGIEELLNRINKDAYSLLISDQRRRTAADAVRYERLFYSAGPLWTRKVAAMIDDGGAICEELGQVTETLNVRSLVVGHTVVRKPAELRCGGKQILMDTGMSYAMMRANAGWLEIFTGSESGDAVTWRGRYLTSSGPRTRKVKDEPISYDYNFRTVREGEL